MPRPPWSGQYESLYKPLGDDFCRSIIADGENMLSWLRNQVSFQLNHGDAPDSSVIELCMLALAGDPDFCRFAVERIARDGGRSADVDVNLLDARDRWKLARSCSQAIRNGEVTPEPPRLVDQPKSSGVGVRTISMFALHDQVIQKSLTRVAECIIDSRLPSELIGSRRGGSRLALVERLQNAAADGQTFLLKADLRNAFDNVPLARLGQVLGRWLPSRLCNLLLASLHAEPQTRGIPQGHAVSPRLLNVYTAQTILPKLRAEFPEVSLTLYVDDLIAVGGSHERMNAMGHRLDQLATAAGFSLKAAVEDSVFAMATMDTPVEALGYGFRVKDGILDTTVSASGWDHLEDHFVELHRDVDAPLRAAEVISGWLAQNGPCLSAERKGEHVGGIVRRLRRCGLQEWPDEAQVSRFYVEALHRHTPVVDAESLRCRVQTIEPCFPPAGVALEELEREPQFFAFVHAWYPQQEQGLQREPGRGGWAWVITDSGHRILDHGCGTAENTSHDLLFLDAIEGIANRLPIVPSGDARVELVMGSASFKHELGRSVQSSGGTVPVDPTKSFSQRFRHVRQRLTSHVSDIRLLQKKDLKVFESSERGRMAKTVRFWAEQAAIDSRLASTVESAG
tara:strand:+ start:33824 stop:35695 length:1872 start_codon:yes stop_codon:yes gene_type:complete